MRFKLPLIALFYGLFLAVAPQAMAGPLRGSAEWRYGQYRADRANGEEIEASHFAQRYSLLYSKSGFLHHGQAGKWDLALGAEWTAINSEVNGDDVDIDTAKILYRGELVLAPGGLPFRLHLFSKDMHKTAFLRDTLLRRRGSDEFAPVSGTILNPDIITDLNNGQHIQSGATLLVGIRNGSYLGRYRNVLSQLPRLLLDYRETLVRNLRSNTPEHYRTRDLAFVSLNKKDNWFHYRFHQYNDFLKKSEDVEEKTWMLGTVDHTLTRQWVHLTNWIKASADGSYIETNKVNSDQPVEKRYELNLFGVARRTNWSASTFGTFQRLSQGDKLEKDLDVPFYASGEFDRNTAWRFRFEGSRSQVQNVASGSEREKDALSTFFRIETFRQGRYILAPELGFIVESGVADVNVVRAGMEFYSNRKYRPRVDFFSSYSVSRTASSNGQGGEATSWENAATIRVSTDLSSRLRTGGGAVLTYVTGDSTAAAGQPVTAQVNQGVPDRGDGDEFSAVLDWFGEHRLSRLTNRLEATYQYQSLPDKDYSTVTLGQTLTYDRRNLAIKMRNLLKVGETQVDSSQSDGANVNARPSRKSFEHNSRISYSPGRNWEASMVMDYDWLDDDNAGSQSRWSVREKFNYNFFTINGIVRKLAEINQSLGYERFENQNLLWQTTTTFNVGGTYYPTKRTLLGIRFRYQLSGETDVFDGHLTAGVNFEKLSVNFAYDYGKLSGDRESAGMEHRWEVKVKKVF